MSASAAAATPAAGGRVRLARRLRGSRHAGLLAGLVLVCIFLAVQQPAFMTWDNWANILRAQSVVFALGIGMTFVVLTGGIDLSIASTAAGAVMIVGLIVDRGGSAELAIAGGFGAGLVLGLLNGVMIGVARIPFFVVTLGTLSIYQSFALLTTKGATISLFGNPEIGTIEGLANGSIGPLPTVVVLLAVLYVLASVVLHLTPFGRSVYAIGSNPEAARLTGINGVRVLVLVYAVCGLCAGLGAVLQVGRLTAAGPQVDPNLMLVVIAAVLIGGTSFTGGEGGMLGTVVGVLFLGVIQNGLTLSDVSTFWQGTVSGVILIAAVGLGVLRDYGWRGLRGRRPAASTSG